MKDPCAAQVNAHVQDNKYSCERICVSYEDAWVAQVNVHVYEGGGLWGFKRISCFDVEGARRTLHLLYCGGVHFDALDPR
jgi:hypothetical protein